MDGWMCMYIIKEYKRRGGFEGYGRNGWNKGVWNGTSKLIVYTFPQVGGHCIVDNSRPPYPCHKAYCALSRGFDFATDKLRLPIHFFMISYTPLVSVTCIP